MKTKSFIEVLAAAALAFVITGCGGGDSDDPPDDGRVAFVNAIPSTANTPVSVRVNGVDMATNVAFGTKTGTAFEVPQGTHSFQVVQTANGQVVVATTPVSVQSSIDQMVIATQNGGATTLTNLGRIDLDTSNTALTGNSRIYFVNAAAGTPVDFSFAVQGSNQQGFPASIQDIGHADMTNETLVSVGTGTAVFTANVNGTPVTSTPIMLEGTKTYTVVLFPGTVAGTYNLQVIPLN
jgi:hypothetical protein